MNRKNILENVSTEKCNINSLDIDKKSTYDILEIINNEDALIAQSVKKELVSISQVVDLIYDKFKNNKGRLIYIGAGTSGRMGILDASEVLPTFNVKNDRIFGIIAGGKEALQFSQEGVEDNEKLAIEDLKKVNFNKNDILIGIAASGRTPYVISALKYCKSIDALGIGLTMSANSQMQKYATKVISINTGPEVIAGSTRMKAGTATKLVLNMISTSLMIKIGRVYQNLMINVVASNEKLKARVVEIIALITKLDNSEIIELLAKSNNKCKNAIIMALKNVTYQESIELLKNNEDNLSKIL